VGRGGASLFVWLVADGWCWFVLREKYYWLVASGWFVLREKYCWLVPDKPSEQGGMVWVPRHPASTRSCLLPRQGSPTTITAASTLDLSSAHRIWKDSVEWRVDPETKASPVADPVTRLPLRRIGGSGADRRCSNPSGQAHLGLELGFLYFLFFID
jgi:hypothetical protein